MSQFLNIQPRQDQPDGYYRVGISRRELHRMLAKNMDALRGYAGSAGFLARTKTTKKINVDDIVEENLHDFERQIKDLLGPDNEAETVIFDADMEEICDGISRAIQSIQEDILRGCQAALHMPHKMLGAEMNRLKGKAQEDLKGRHFLIKTGVEPGTNILAEYSAYPSRSVAFVKDTLENISMPYIYELIRQLKEQAFIGDDEELSLENFEKIMRHFNKFTDSINAFLHKITELAFSSGDCSFELLWANLTHELKKYNLYAEKNRDDELGELFWNFAREIHEKIEGMTQDEFEMMSLEPEQSPEIEQFKNAYKKAKLTQCEHSAMIFIPGKIGLETDDVEMTQKESDFLDREIKRIASENSLVGINDWDKKYLKELTESVNNEFHAGYRLRKIVDIKVALAAYYGGDLEVDINFDDEESPSSRKRRTNGAKKSTFYEMPFPETAMTGGAREPENRQQPADEPESVPAPVHSQAEAPKAVPVTKPAGNPVASRTETKNAAPARQQAAAPDTAPKPRQNAAQSSAAPDTAPKPRQNAAQPAAAPDIAPKPAAETDDEPLHIDTENFGSLENKLCTLKELYAKLTAAPLAGEKEIKKSRMILKIVETAMEVCEDPRLAAVTGDSRKERIVGFALKICAQSMTKKGNFILNGIDLPLLIQDIWELSHAGVNDRELIPVLGGIKSILDKMDSKIADLQRKLRESEGQGTTIETLKSTLDEKNAAIERNKQSVQETHTLLAGLKEDRDRLQEEALARGELPDEKTEQKIAREIRGLMTKLITLAREKEQLEKDAASLQEALVAVHEKHTPDPELLDELERVMRDREELLSQLNTLAEKHYHA